MVYNWAFTGKHFIAIQLIPSLITLEDAAIRMSTVIAAQLLLDNQANMWRFKEGE